MRRMLSSFVKSTLPLLLHGGMLTAQNMPQQTSSPAQVVYFVNDGGMQVYDVNPQTGNPTYEANVTVEAVDPTVVPSANDHFIYVLGTNPGSGAEQLWVYPTTPTGVPLNPPLQQVDLTSFTYNFMIDPDGTLAYAAQSTTNSEGEPVAEILSFAIDSTTGLISGTPAVQATYPPNGLCGAGYTASFSLLGFNSSGSQIYDEWNCASSAGTYSIYNTRSVNQQTGALGPDTSAFYTDVTSVETAYVNFTRNAIIDFTWIGYGSGNSELDVYPLSGGGPTINCAAAMLPACGYGLSDSVDPSGNYIFIQLSSEVADVTKIDVASAKIANTGYNVSGKVQAFGSDGTLVYTELSSTSLLHTVLIYLFNPATGATSTSPGDQISVQQTFFAVVPAVRK
ncbi:MAG: hypothetical protein WBX38_22535 [Candidatus Sulfotelmatobacter sp.]